MPLGGGDMLNDALRYLLSSFFFFRNIISLKILANKNKLGGKRSISRCSGSNLLGNFFEHPLHVKPAQQSNYSKERRQQRKIMLCLLARIRKRIVRVNVVRQRYENRQYDYLFMCPLKRG